MENEAANWMQQTRICQPINTQQAQTSLELMAQATKD